MVNEAEDALTKSKAKLSAVLEKAKSRLEVAKKLRDAMYRRFEGGQAGFEEFLVWQKRYDDLANDVIMMTGGDKLGRLEDQLAELKQIEKRAKELFDGGEVQETDFLVVRYYLLEAEESLARAKAENGEGLNNASNKE